MATLAQIQEKDTTPLDALERELVRQLLSITGKVGTPTYIESENRMDNLSTSQCQIVRALLEDYDDISFDTTKAFGGQKGINFDPERDKEALARELRRILYPNASNEDPEDTDGDSEFSPLGAIHFIPIKYTIGNQGNFS